MATPSHTMLLRSARHGARLPGLAILVASLLFSGCGRSAYEERLEATVQAKRSGGGGTSIGAEAAEPPAAPAENAAPSGPPSGESQDAAERGAEATNASGQGVVGRAVLAPTDAFP